MSLLDKAKRIPLEQTRNGVNVSVDEMELAIAWLKDEVNPVQISKVLGFKPNTTIHNRISIWLREAYRKGLIREV